MKSGCIYPGIEIIRMGDTLEGLTYDYGFREGDEEAAANFS